MPLTQTELELLEGDGRTHRDVFAVHASPKANSSLALTPQEVARAVSQESHHVAQILHGLDGLDLGLLP